MAQSKAQKREAALVKITVSIADDLASGVTPSFEKRQEYNRLKSALGYTDYIRPGVWMI